MHDTKTAPRTNAMSPKSRQEWLDRGFDPNREITEYFGCFTLEEAQRSLFESTRSLPIPVYLTDDRDGEVRIPVVIDTARCNYPEPAEREEYPDWYFEGWQVPSGYSTTGTVEIRRIRIYVLTLTREFTDNDMFEWQYVKPPLASEGGYYSQPQGWRDPDATYPS